MIKYNQWEYNTKLHSGHDYYNAKLIYRRRAGRSAQKLNAYLGWREETSYLWFVWRCLKSLLWHHFHSWQKGTLNNESDSHLIKRSLKEMPRAGILSCRKYFLGRRVKSNFYCCVPVSHSCPSIPWLEAQAAKQESSSPWWPGGSSGKLHHWLSSPFLSGNIYPS